MNLKLIYYLTCMNLQKLKYSKNIQTYLRTYVHIYSIKKPAQFQYFTCVIFINDQLHDGNTPPRNSFESFIFFLITGINKFFVFILVFNMNDLKFYIFF